MINETEEFNGTFYFTNPTDKERSYLWNNREYTFPAKSTVPLIIMGEPLENIQEIRKRFAYRMAQDRFYEGEKPSVGESYTKLKNMGNGLPPTFNPTIFEPWIEECLTPLPIAKSNVKQAKSIDSERNYKASKAMGEGDNPNMIFAEENKRPPVLGKMSDN